MFSKILISFYVLSLVYGFNEDEKISVSKSDFEILMSRMKNIENFAKEQSDLVQKQQDTIDTLNVKVNDLTNECGTTVDNRERRHKVRRQSSNTLVAFSATLNQVNVEHIGVHQNIVFSDVITNIGNGYNNHHGIFIAPVSGLYLFMTKLLSGQNVEYVAAIEINGSDIVRMFERGTDNRHGSATQTVIVHLHKGDDVAVQSLSADHTYWGDKYSTFSGVLLHEMEMDNPIIG